LVFILIILIIVYHVILIVYNALIHQRTVRVVQFLRIQRHPLYTILILYLIHVYYNVRLHFMLIQLRKDVIIVFNLVLPARVNLFV
jgi:hypothetical protein